jgi:hypothetical protein
MTRVGIEWAWMVMTAKAAVEEGQMKKVKQINKT